MSYNELLEFTKRIYEKQENEVKETMHIVEKINSDEDIETVLNILNENQRQYLSYTHN